MKNCRLYASLNKVLRHCVGGAKFVDSFYLLSSWSDLSERYLAMHLPNVGVCLQFFLPFVLFLLNVITAMIGTFSYTIYDFV